MHVKGQPLEKMGGGHCMVTSWVVIAFTQQLCGSLGENHQMPLEIVSLSTSCDCLGEWSPKWQQFGLFSFLWNKIEKPYNDTVSPVYLTQQNKYSA